MESLIMSKYSGDYIISQYLDTGERHNTSECSQAEKSILFYNPRTRIAISTEVTFYLACPS